MAQEFYMRYLICKVLQTSTAFSSLTHVSPALWKSQYHWCQCCRWGSLAWTTGRDSATAAASRSQHVFFHDMSFSISPVEVGFLTSPLPEHMTILMIDRGSPDCRREGRERTTETTKRRERERGKRGVDNPTRSERCPVFCFQWWDQWPVRPRGDRQSNWRPGRNRCSYTMNMHLVGGLFTKSQAADFPFLETKNTANSPCVPPVGLYKGKMLLSHSDSVWFTSR